LLEPEFQIQILGRTVILISLFYSIHKVLLEVSLSQKPQNRIRKEDKQGVIAIYQAVLTKLTTMQVSPLKNA